MATKYIEQVKTLIAIFLQKSANSLQAANNYGILNMLIH
jgi:hypothetical protein